jgi:ATP-dependent Lhr-like helicase
VPLSAFHPTVAAWFKDTLGAPAAPQVRAWPAIRAGAHVLVAAPTGSGKTLAAFLSALDGLLAQGAALADETSVLYISPLKALGNDVQKNLARPLAELRARDATLPDVRVLVRSGDTPQRERQAMLRRAPHILVTTPESLYILLTSEGGRGILETVRTVIVDEIHAVLGDKRGAHLALSLERLEDLCGRPVQRVGLSATQRPLAAVGRFLAGLEADGTPRAVTLIDEGHSRPMELSVELPPSPLEAVCSHETWSEIYARIAQLIAAHRTTLVFVGTRKLSERVGAQLAALLGADAVACHHSSLAKERRLDAEQRLKSGALRALVATASLELGIDVGEIDLVVQVGALRSIATLLQRVGRAGHGVGRTPRGALFPLSPDELVEAAALLRAVREDTLDVTPQPRAPLDILAQQVVASCVSRTWGEEELRARLTRAWPYRALSREDFARTVALHTGGRYALLHRDGVQGRLRATRRARITAVTSGGAIPDRGDYKVVLSPGGTVVGSLDEDFAIESSAGDVFQLGNMSWRVLRTEPGVMHVADAQGAPPSLPFWVGEGPARTRELSGAIGEVRERGAEAGWLREQCGLSAEVADELARYLREGAESLGAVPTQRQVVLERFFDESGGMQLVLHAPFGGRINRAWGLALRKRFCRGFGFELQAAANEEAVVISLGPMHSFPLADVFDYLSPDTVRDLLVQALLPAPMFTTRWRWNVTRALLLERSRGGKRVPPPLVRMRAGDLLAGAFPAAVACGETLPPGDIEIPEGHPLVDQTLADCLTEALDVDGLEEVLRGLRDGTIARYCVDTAEPSAFARGALTIGPYGFLDDAPLEERRTQAVLTRRALSPRAAETLGALDPAAVARVREEAWPDPRDAEELHEALLWMGYLAEEEARPWSAWIEALAATGRVQRADGRWFATEAPRDPVRVLRGRMEALGPVHSDDPLMATLEAQGHVLRIPLAGAQGWCDRRLLARIQRYTLEDLRRRIRPVPCAVFRRFLAGWQFALPARQLEGPAGVLEVIGRLAGWEAPVPVWEKELLPRRVRDYRPDYLDQLGLGGRIAWGRLWGSSKAALRSTPIALFPREDAASWLGLAGPAAADLELSWPARAVRAALAERGALFQVDLEGLPGLLPSDAERGIDELVSAGLVSADSYSSLRQHLIAPHRRRRPLVTTGRWSPFRADAPAAPEPEFAARALLRRYGVVFRAVVQRERIPVPWRDLARALRALELRGDVRGGRFVDGFAGEQFGLEEAVVRLRREGDEHEAGAPFDASDPLQLDAVLVPGAGCLASGP